MAEPTAWWCTRCAGPATFYSASIDPRYPIVKCRDCKIIGSGVATLTQAASAAQLIHDRQHVDRCPTWCMRERPEATNAIAGESGPHRDVVEPRRGVA